MPTRRRTGFIRNIHPMFNTMRVSFPYLDAYQPEDDPGIVIPIPTGFPAQALRAGVAFTADWPYSSIDYNFIGYEKQAAYDLEQVTTNPDYLSNFEILD